MTSTAVTPRESPLDSPLGQLIAPYQAQLAPFLRDGITLERVAAELVLASRKTPNLDKCPAPALVDAVCRALQTGGAIGQDVYIVPFFTQGAYEPTVMLDYKFKAELVIHAGGARSIDAHPVWSDDRFTIQYGSDPRIEHTPAMKPDRARTLVGAYAVAFLGFNHKPKIHFMPIDEVEAIRKRSKQWNPEKVKNCPGWYACARVVHQIVKLLPKNPRLRAVLDLIEREEGEEFGDRPATVDADGVDLTATEPTVEELIPDDREEMSDEDIEAQDRDQEQRSLLSREPRRPRNAVREGR